MFNPGPVSSIYIWGKNLVAESEAKDGGNWRRMVCDIVRQFQSPARKYGYAIQWNFCAEDWNRRTIAPSISAIFGLPLLLGRMTEVLTPDIYGAHCPGLANHVTRRIDKYGIIYDKDDNSFTHIQTHTNFEHKFWHENDEKTSNKISKKKLWYSQNNLFIKIL